MPCYHPLHGFRSLRPNANGKRPIVFSSTRGDIGEPVSVPCGQCIGCRLEYSRQWAIRCVHEASLHASNSFLTLTYDDDHLPRDMSLDLDHFQRFMKRLRKKVGPVRFFHCGEYGEKFKRPHYHAIIFGYDFPDKQLFKIMPRGDRLYRSPILEKLWPYGYSTIGDVTFESAAYVARYVVKKINGKAADEIDEETGLKHYELFDSVSGEIHQRRKEYTTMSRNPGIAAGWYQKYKSDVFPADEVIMRGKALKPPKYYDALYEAENPNAFAEMKEARKKAAEDRAHNSTPDRLAVREKVKLAQISYLRRSVE